LSASRTARVCNRRGLHARAAAKFVSEAGRYDARIRLTKDGETVDADSIMELLMLAAGPGAEVTITAEGPEADAALNALADLIECGFEEPD
jgi:phosphocarrier protein